MTTWHAEIARASLRHYAALLHRRHDYHAASLLFLAAHEARGIRSEVAYCRVVRQALRAADLGLSRAAWGRSALAHVRQRMAAHNAILDGAAARRPPRDTRSPIDRLIDDATRAGGGVRSRRG